MGDTRFMLSLFSSVTFYHTVGLLLLAMVLLLAVTAVLLRRLSLVRRRRRVSLLHDESGVSTAIDFTLTIPLFMFSIMLMVQLMAMINDALLVHYSAYSAARSARVWLPVRDERIADINPSLPWQERDKLEEQIRRDIDNKIRYSAKLALIPAAPADRHLVNPKINIPLPLIEAIATSMNKQDSLEGLERKARYAFDENNSTIQFDYANGPALTARPGGNLIDYYPRPVTAQVTFKIYLGIGIGRLFARAPGGEIRGDNAYQTISASMTLL